MKKRSVFIIIPIFVLLCGCSTYVGGSRRLPVNAIRPTIAVTEFENRAGVAGEWSLGSGMADLLVAELIDSDNFVVIERQQLPKILGEHALQKLPQFRAEGRVKSGRLVHSRYLIRGVVNDFSEVSRFSLFAGITHLFTRWTMTKARVSMTLTVISVETGEIVDSISCAANVRAYFASAGGDKDNIVFGGDAFFKTPLGEATELAIRRGVNELTEHIPVMYWQPMVAKANDQLVIINGGENYNLNIGDRFIVRGEPEYITDPMTGDVLNVVPGENLAEVRVIKVENKISYAEIIKGGNVRRGNFMEQKFKSPYLKTHDK